MQLHSSSAFIHVLFIFTTDPIPCLYILLPVAFHILCLLALTSLVTLYSDNPYSSPDCIA